MNGLAISDVQLITYAKTVTVILVIIVAVALIMRLTNRKSVGRIRGIQSELKNIKLIQKRDAKILRQNKLLRLAVNITSISPFKLSSSDEEYWQYNIDRIGIKIQYRGMTAIELHAIIQLITVLLVIIMLLVAIFINWVIGWVSMVAVVAITSTCPMMVMRQTVRRKDAEISKNFLDFYLMIHYILINSGTTPLGKLLKSYGDSTSSLEMKRFIDVCIHYIDIYGEMEAASHIAKEYRESVEITKLMRLIKQTYSGANVAEDLMGFKKELLATERHILSKRADKMNVRAKLSFNILMPILVQAILSAASIYFEDIRILSSLFR